MDKLEKEDVQLKTLEGIPDVQKYSRRQSATQHPSPL